MRPRKGWRFEVAYPLSKYEWGSLDEELEKIANDGVRTASGTGFGYRDLCFEFTCEKEAMAAKFTMEALEYDLDVGQVMFCYPL